MKNPSKYYLGWQVGISYESVYPEGNSYERMMQLLDEMQKNGMNLLSLMMISYNYFDEGHDGFCWPVSNRKLECYCDRKCINADIKTEYISKIIEEAEKRGIEIQLFSNWGIYNPQRIISQYKNVMEQINNKGEYNKWLFCNDCDDVWELATDEFTDLLKFYNYANVKSIGYERLSYSDGTCYCPYTSSKFYHDTGKSIYNASSNELNNWKVNNISSKLKIFNTYLKSIKPGIEIWLHTSCAPGWGHNPAKLKDSNVDFVVPHIAHFRMDQQYFNKMLNFIYPNNTVLHFCVRNKPLKNYNIWIKTPDIIHEIGKWIEEYDGDNLKGILFFNENSVSNENRNAVYDLVKTLRAGTFKLN